MNVHWVFRTKQSAWWSQNPVLTLLTWIVQPVPLSTLQISLFKAILLHSKHQLSVTVHIVRDNVEIYTAFHPQLNPCPPLHLTRTISWLWSYSALAQFNPTSTHYLYEFLTRQAQLNLQISVLQWVLGPSSFTTYLTRTVQCCYWAGSSQD